jgi:DNA-binding beta-propeller fold protein YncE
MLVGVADARAPVRPLGMWCGPGAAPGQFFVPDGLSVDAMGHVYVADRANHRIQKFSSTGRVLAVWGGVPGNGPGEIGNPYGVAADDYGNVYVADTNNNRILKFTSRGRFVAQWGAADGTGPPGSKNGEFNDPRGIAVDDAGNVYVADHNNNRIQKLSPDGRFLARWGAHGGDGTAGTGNGEFRDPRGVAIDHAGHVYVADKTNNRVQELGPDGRFIRRWGAHGGDGTGGLGPGEFNLPYNIAIAADGHLFVSDVLNNRVQEFSPTGRFLAVYGRNISGAGPRAVRVRSVRRAVTPGDPFACASRCRARSPARCPPGAPAGGGDRHGARVRGPGACGAPARAHRSLGGGPPGRHDPHRRVHAKGPPGAGDVDQPRVLEGERVVRRRPQVEDRDAAAGPQDPRDLVAGALAVGGLVNVVDRKRGDDGVEARVREWQRAHVGVHDVDALADALGLGVGERRAAAVVGLVDGRPDVDADGPAAGQPLRCSDQQQAAPAADVEDVLAAVQLKPVEQAIALDELPAAARVQHRRDGGEEHDAAQRHELGQRRDAGERERDRGHDQHGARDREATDDARRVEPVVDLHTARVARSSSGPSPRCRREWWRP